MYVCLCDWIWIKFTLDIQLHYSTDFSTVGCKLTIGVLCLKLWRSSYEAWIECFKDKLSLKFQYFDILGFEPSLFFLVIEYELYSNLSSLISLLFRLDVLS